MASPASEHTTYFQAVPEHLAESYAAHEFLSYPVVKRYRIVEVFACSDFCPEPLETYMRRVYKDVTDSEECFKLGGVPFSVTGWVTTRYCAVFDAETKAELSKAQADEEEKIKRELDRLIREYADRSDSDR